MSWKLLKNSENLTINLIRDEKPRQIYLGLSGGVDSVVLAYFISNILHKFPYPLNITVLHVNHSLRSESDYEEEFAASVAKKLGFGFISHKVPREEVQFWKTNIENKARAERKNFFKKYVKDDDLLLLAHHLDDDIEWNLLQKFKSSNVGPSMYIPQRNGIIFRPFLEVTKQSLANVAETYKIKYIVDSSNKDDRFERNFIRNNLVPLVDERFKNFREHFLFQKYQSTSSLTRDNITKNIYEFPGGSTLYLGNFPRKVEDQFKAVSFWINTNLKKLNNGEGRGSISRQILKIIEAKENNRKGPLFLSRGFFCFVDSECLHILDAKCFIIKSVKSFSCPDEEVFLESTLKNGPIFLLDQSIEGSPASAFGLPNNYQDLSVCTSGYIIKNLKKLKKKNFNLFKGLIEEKSS